MAVVAARRVRSRYLDHCLKAGKSMSGYDIRQIEENLSWLIGNRSCDSPYPALRRPLRDGFAAVDLNLREAKPAEKRFCTTEPGRSALHDWIDQPTKPGGLKAVAMRLVLASYLSRPGLIAVAVDGRSEVTRHQPRPAGIVSVLDEARTVVSITERLSQTARWEKGQPASVARTRSDSQYRAWAGPMQLQSGCRFDGDLALTEVTLSCRPPALLPLERWSSASHGHDL